MSRRLVVARLLKVLIGLVTAVALIEIVFWPSAPYALLKLAGRSACNWPETLRMCAYAREFRAARDRIQGSARMVTKDGDLQLWDVPGARKFWVFKKFDSLNAHAFAEQVANQYYHPAVHIQPDDIVLDVGADFGSVTWRALRSGARKVVAIEIDPDKIPCLRRTFAGEIETGRVVVVPAGVWDHDGTVELGGDSVVLDRDSRKRVVPVTTIDEIVASLGLPRVDFISMDIEGAEKPALRGAAATLRKYHPRMAIAAEHLPDDADAIPKTVRAINPRYDVICGRCEPKVGLFEPMVLFFSQRSPNGASAVRR